ncbi:MAG: hypothetical protein CBC79_01530 [Gammaproteobacteria bacterium TMED119]|nr:MAG: hypothetical protein CBC79_01530 [Gammaproteobacteria bacterium TMED119]RCL45741.1 MAG: hypothetical protein DBW91_04240 [Candidatus Thioglobus sp.]|tara:strand:+ start:2041 stop:2784 length:744 start_codon:yes stop_codon:yes gene_type:complete
MFDLTTIRVWYETSAGRLISSAVEKHLRQITACMFGYVAIEVGHSFVGRDLLSACTIQKKFLVDRSDSADIKASPASLPITCDSVDLFVLPHTLDFTSKPHQILREVERSLVAEGHLIMIGFNPYSFYGLWRLFLSRTKVAPWNASFYSPRRLRDWCSLLGFEEIDMQYVAHLPPFKRLQRWQKLAPIRSFLEQHFTRSGGVYILVVRKRVARLTPLKRVWPTANELLPNKVPNPGLGRNVKMYNHD